MRCSHSSLIWIIKSDSFNNCYRVKKNSLYFGHLEKDYIDSMIEQMTEMDFLFTHMVFGFFSASTYPVCPKMRSG